MELNAALAHLSVVFLYHIDIFSHALPLLCFQVVRRRRLSATAHAMEWSPVFDSYEHSSSRQFLKQLTFQHPLITNELAEVPTQAINRHILCLKVSV